MSEAIKKEHSYVKGIEEFADEDETSSQNGMQRTLGYGILFLIALNFIFDSSIFYIPQMGAELSGPSSILAWIVLFVISIYVAMCFAEIISMCPNQEGGIYSIAKMTYGSFLSYLAGWTTWLAGNFALLVSIPAGLELFILVDSTEAYLVKFALAVLTVLFFSYLAYRGKDLGPKVIVFFTVIAIALFLILIVTTYVDIPALLQGKFATPLDFSHYRPFFIHNDGILDAGLLFATLFIIATTFFGLESVTFFTGEVKDAKTVMPKVLVRSMVLVWVITFIFVVGSLAVLDQKTYVDSYIYYEDLMNITLGDYGVLIIPFVIFLSGVVYFSEGLGWILSGPRMIYSIAKDRLFPPSYAMLDELHHTPTKAIKLQIVVLLIGMIITYAMYIFTDLDPFYVFHELFVFMSLILTMLLVIAVPLLRKKEPNLERPYKVPMGNTLPYFFALVFAVAIGCWIYFDGGFFSTEIAIFMILLGIPVYCVLLLAYDPDVFMKFKRGIVKIGVLIERITMTSEHVDLIHDPLGDITGKKVLLFGAGYGAVVPYLAERVGKKGQIYIVDLSHRLLLRISERGKKKGMLQLTTIYDNHIINRVHDSVPKVDLIISIGMLHHLQDLRKVIKEMYRRLPDGGKIVFKDEIDLFKIVPNAGWASRPDKIMKILKEEGFVVKSQVKESLLMNHLFIYALKTKEKVPFI